MAAQLRGRALEFTVSDQIVFMDWDANANLRSLGCRLPTDTFRRVREYGGSAL
jgi:hypothetical protein